MPNTHQKHLGTFLHLSIFSRYFIPFGNFIGPLIFWLLHKKKSEFLDAHGKQAINFQISITLYILFIGSLTLLLLAYNLIAGLEGFTPENWQQFLETVTMPVYVIYTLSILGILLITGFILEFIFIIKAALAARNGNIYNYPLTINFLK
ncbi:DUF4870 domain-containing protein [Bizionia sediminis]|uniref:DUF4870 domain-containing protein n=1 Tax=Bizionia sediminis TaxID=1737064 RepID=A0ABW5KPL3_9FLAO